MLQVGDRIIYTGRYKTFSRNYVNEKGTIMSVKDVPYIREEQVFEIRFDNSLYTERTIYQQMYRANLELANETPDWEI